jgi:hypothetical protein
MKQNRRHHKPLLSLDFNTEQRATICEHCGIMSSSIWPSMVCASNGADSGGRAGRLLPQSYDPKKTCAKHAFDIRKKTVAEPQTSCRRDATFPDILPLTQKLAYLLTR